MNGAVVFPPLLNLLQVLLVLWLSGCVLLAILSVVPATAQQASVLWPLMLTEAVIIAAIVLPLALGSPFATIGLLVLAARTGWESGHVNGLRGQTSAGVLAATRTRSAVLCVAIVLSSWLIVLQTDLSPPVAVILSLALMAAVLPIRAALTPLQQVAILPGLPLFALGALLSDSIWNSALIVAFLFVESFDSFALLGGKLFGRWRIFPIVSPNKTFEGLLTGLIGLIVVAVVINLTSFHWDWHVLIFLMAVCTLVAVASDLAASAPKRAAGVKDYPSIHVQHGGVLDIVDSWLVAGPVFCVSLWLASHWFS